MSEENEKYHYEMVREMTGNAETICDGLGVANRTLEQLDASSRIMHSVTHGKINNSEALLELMNVYNIPDTPDTRKIASEAFTFGGAIAEAEHIMMQQVEKALSEVLGKCVPKH